jgi:hypothetical protein
MLLFIIYLLAYEDGTDTVFTVTVFDTIKVKTLKFEVM